MPDRHVPIRTGVRALPRMVSGVAPRWIDYIPLDEIVPAERNPKGHALDALAASVEQYGFVEPIVLDERTGRLVAGHGRLEHLQRAHAGGQAPPSGVVAGDDGRWRAPVVRGWASADDDHASAYLVASNRIPELGGWNRPLLAQLLDGLGERDLSAVGFERTDIGALLEEFGHDPLADLPPPEHVAGREVQGLREVVLVLQGDNYRDAQLHLERLRSAWGEDVAGLVVLRALRRAAEAA